ncbi:MAG: hydrolase 1, exosortase A system-associated [Undibacterium sp.]|nr:hydrolase 1, exosortase A system-associated [Undibacterium sp.]
MSYEEHALQFSCQDASLLGILSLPQRPHHRGILFVVGGPQYRAGSHRQFTLLARQFASQGIAVMRFDYRGMGDSEGEQRDFTEVDEDIRAAVRCFFQQVPAMTEVVLWGLCDAASAALFYAHQDSRVTGLVLLNPWVRTEQGAAKAYLKHYYFRRLLDSGFWKKFIAGELSLFTAIQSVMQQIGRLKPQHKNMSATVSNDNRDPDLTNLPQKMYQCLQLFKGKTLVILCSEDLTAQEFSDVAGSSRKWKKLMSSSQITKRHLAGANHTFSQRSWREEIGHWTISWIKNW